VTALEATIVNAAIRAGKTFSKMTDGAWLSEAPEHFLQNEVARAVWLAKRSRKVFIDLSNQRIDEWTQDKKNLLSPNQRNRPRQRPDIVISNASWDHKAVIEIKTRGTSNFDVVLRDAEKIQNSNHAMAGYLLVYFDGWKYRKKDEIHENRAAAKGHLDEQFINLTNKLKESDKRWFCVAKKVGGVGGELTKNELLQRKPKNRKWARGRSFAWGIGLYRLMR
jgi:hypothetical protein